MTKLQSYDNKSEGESDLTMTKGGTGMGGGSVPEHNMAAVNTGRSYPKSGNGMPPKVGMGSLPDDVRGDTLKPL